MYHGIANVGRRQIKYVVTLYILVTCQVHKSIILSHYVNRKHISVMLASKCNWCCKPLFSEWFNNVAKHAKQSLGLFGH